MSKNRFPLDMGNGVKATTISELTSNFDIDKVLFYFNNGQLLQWLEDRYYDYEADQIKMLFPLEDKSVLSAKLLNIFEQTPKAPGINEESNKKIMLLRKYTSDDNIFKYVDYVAFDQNELQELVNKGVKVIYLCGDSFKISVTDKGKKYIGINSPNIKIIEPGEIDLSSSGISIQECVLSHEDISRIVEEKAQINDINISFALESMLPDGLNPTENIEAINIYNEGISYLNQKIYDHAFTLLKQAANMDYPDAQYQYARMYQCGLGTSKDINSAEKWYKAAMDNGHVKACEMLGDVYKELKDYPKALECYKLGAERGDLYSLDRLGSMYISDYDFKDVDKGIETLLSAVSKGYYGALRTLACYYEGEGDYEKAIKYYEKYLPHAYNYEHIMTDIAELYYKMNNIDQAINYYTNAAEEDSDACKWLINYYKSKGNKIQALKWYHYAWDKHAMDESDIGFSEADLLLGGALEGTAASDAVNNVLDKLKSFTSFFR